MPTRLTLNVVIADDAVEDPRDELRYIAYRLGYRHGHNRGNISSLLIAIAEGEVLCVPADKNQRAKTFLNESSE